MTLQTLYYDTLVSSPELETDPAAPAHDGTAGSSIPPALPPSRTHVMLAIISTTSQSAFSKLQERLDLASFYHSEECVEDLTACKAAFKTVDSLRIRAFSPAEEVLTSAPVPLPKMPPWLRSFVSRAENPSSHDTLTSFFLRFLVQAPQEYLDIVLPLLDQRLESPIDESSEDSPVVGLTTVQAIALDVYAHWSVLMFLVEDDSWWIGTLPDVTLTGMVNAYGDDFVSKLIPGSGSEPAKWWPGSMLNILREVKKFR